MYRIVLVFAVLGLALVVGCSSSTKSEPSPTSEAPNNRLEFKQTKESQHVVFLTQQAPMVGGPAAGAVYLGPSEQQRVNVDGRGVMISHAAHRDLLARLSRTAPKDTMFFLVEARVRLENMSGTITTNPPMSSSYLGVVFEEIKRVEWYTTEPKR